MMIATKEQEEVVMSFVSFEQSRDIIQAAADRVHEGENLTYLNTMVDVADKEMVIALAKRYKVSQGFVMRAILEQWRDTMLADCK
jgi:hypothetical protein